MNQIVTKSPKKSRKCFNPSPDLLVSVELVPVLIRGMCVNYRNVLRVLLGYRKRFKVVQVSHAKVALKAGCSISTVKRALDYFGDLGLVGKWYCHMHASIYNLHLLFFAPYWQNKLKEWLPIIDRFRFAVWAVTSKLGSVAKAGFNGVIWSSELQCLFNNNKQTKSNQSQEQKVFDHHRYVQNLVRGVPPTPHFMTEHELSQIFDGERADALKASVQTSDRTTNNSINGKDMATIPQHIRDIQSINLTYAGQLMLLGLTPQGIATADKEMLQLVDNPPSFPFKEFVKRAAHAGGWDPETLPLTAQIMAAEKISPYSEPLKDQQLNKPDAITKRSNQFLAILGINNDGSPAQKEVPPETYEPPLEQEDPYEYIDPDLLKKYYTT